MPALPLLLSLNELTHLSLNAFNWTLPLDPHFSSNDTAHGLLNETAERIYCWGPSLVFLPLSLKLLRGVLMHQLGNSADMEIWDQILPYFQLGPPLLALMVLFLNYLHDNFPWLFVLPLAELISLAKSVGPKKRLTPLFVVVGLIWASIFAMIEHLPLEIVVQQIISLENFYWEALSWTPVWFFLSMAGAMYANCEIWIIQCADFSLDCSGTYTLRKDI